MTDKAVSTEDLCVDVPEDQTGYLGVIKLETFLHTLVENKVEALKNETRQTPSLQSSPKSILRRLRFMSSPAIGTNPAMSLSEKRKLKLRKKAHSMEGRKKPVFKHEASVCSSEVQMHQSPAKSFDEASEDERLRSLNQNVISIDNSSSDKSHSCYCRDATGKLIPYDEDYVSVKIEGFDDDTDKMLAEEAMRRARRKRRRRRKRRMKKRMAMNIMLDPAVHVDDHFKMMNTDDLPQRARWTIVATACILLFMCLLLVGITLRMAPLIDDLVRKENEELLNSLQSGSSVHNIS